MKLVVVAGILAGLIAVGWFAADVWDEPAALDRASIQKIPLGEATHVSNLSSIAFEEVCLLEPYQDRLAPEEASAARVNDYLARNDYAAAEHLFAFVLIGRESIEIEVFKRSRHLDVLAAYHIAAWRVEMLPSGFTPHSCAKGQYAAFAKTRFKERTYLVLGELR